MLAPLPVGHKQSIIHIQIGTIVAESLRSGVESRQNGTIPSVLVQEGMKDDVAPQDTTKTMWEDVADVATLAPQALC
jgi:hypothetical protein